MHMSLTTRRVILWVTAAIGAYVGAWASFWPVSFYDTFPGLGRIWISVDGPFNEHLIRDVGGLYLGLAAASAAATFSRKPDPGRVIGVAWTVFGLPHLIYHARHFAEMSPIDAVGNAFTLGGSLILGVVLMLPGPRAHSAASPQLREQTGGER
jgi:hypothetical protein